jgi:hypothetical protein
MLLFCGNAFVGSSVGLADGVVNLAGYVALDTAHDLVFGFAFGQAASEVVAGGPPPTTDADALTRTRHRRPLTDRGPRNPVNAHLDESDRTQFHTGLLAETKNML